MMGKLLLRGMLIGILAGILAFGFARVFGEPSVEAAIALEEAGGHHHHDHGAEAEDPAAAAPHDHGAEAEEEGGVTRATQAGIGLLTGTTVYGMALGGILALTFAGVQGRVSTARPRVTVAWLTLAGFVALVLVPGLKYPPNPPAVGSGDTIGARTALFFMMLVLSVLAMVIAVALARRLAPRHGAWNAALIGAVAYVLLVGIAMLAMPVSNEVAGSGFPGDTLWEFRLASLGTRAVLFAVLGAGFGLAAERALAPKGRPAYA